MAPRHSRQDGATPPPRSGDGDYTERLRRLQGAGWKRLVGAQLPYRWNLRRLFGHRVVLDLGCGIGRLLAHLAPGSVGVDRNPESVRVCRQRGLTAYTDAEFGALAAGVGPPRFEGLLAAHLLEHLPAGAAADLLRRYLPRVVPGGRVVLICPQQRGYASDPTHVTYLDHAGLRDVCGELGLAVREESSFPLPAPAGRWFTYNEFVTLAVLPG